MLSRADIGRCMRHGGDRDLGISVAGQMDDVCDRLPVSVVRAAVVFVVALKTGWGHFSIRVKAAW
jgi:hypothetical protein